ncbi:MAG: 30S ribosome-binding factor RbfA [Chloroflexi bacterium]|nr:30S ribosome-binding factor RbfA [Chloroflexota bacterium]
MSRRLERLNVLLRREISDLLRRQVKDPRLAEFTSITHVDTSPDLQHARVYVSIMGTPEEKALSMTALTAAAAYLRHELRDRLIIKRVPILQFRLDESIEEAAHILEMMNELGRKRRE